jgi:UDP-3-O-[3-hydroxymyristoyl] N-acetylglucosamine deacetylase
VSGTASSRRLAHETRPLAGAGLFSARPARVTFRPAPHLGICVAGGSSGMVRMPVGPGLLSRGCDWAAAAQPALIRNTTLAVGGRVAATVEHALGACAGLGVFGVDIVLEEGPEVPILDGSARAFVEVLRPALAPGGAVEPVVLRRAVEVRAGEAFIRAEPPGDDGPIHYSYTLDYGPGAALRPQTAAWRGDPEEFIARIAPARTFCLRHEALAARQAGLFAHLTARDMLVIGDDGNPIDNAWRLDDEPARHKLLDLIGDLALLGRPLHARVHAHRAGHALTHDLCRRVAGEAVRHAR